jgi:hypothetical protein
VQKKEFLFQSGFFSEFVFRNIEQNPTTDKFRSIRKENKTFGGKVWRWDSAQQFLYGVGWIDVSINYDNNIFNIS